MHAVLLTPLMDTREAGVIAPSPIFLRLVFLPSWVTESFCTEKATGGLVCLLRPEDQNRGHPRPRRTPLALVRHVLVGLSPRGSGQALPLGFSVSLSETAQP